MKIENSLAARLLGKQGDEPWLTLTKALEETEDLLADASGEEEQLLLGFKQYLREQQDKWIAIAEPD